MEEPTRVEGTVLKLRCSKCGSTFPHFRFSGDTDMVTAGLGSATSSARSELILAKMEAAEWNEFDVDGARRFEQRLSQQLGRSDIRVLRLLRVDKQSELLRGLSFADFRKTYIPPKLYFSCACCPDGEQLSF